MFLELTIASVTLNITKTHAAEDILNNMFDSVLEPHSVDECEQNSTNVLFRNVIFVFILL